MHRLINQVRARKIEAYYKNKLSGFSILADNIWDPHNVAAIARTADGFGISTIYLYYSYNNFPDFKKVGKKSSSSATNWISFENVKDISSFAEQKKREGYLFLGSMSCEGAYNLSSYSFPDKCIVILGSENKGISSELKSFCDGFINIPMAGMVESYNVSVAAGVIMYEAFKQKGKGIVLRGAHE